MPRKNIYYKYINRNLPLNDQLAAARSLLADERTFLSYQRTGITLAIAGITFIKFFDTLWIVIVGWGLLPIALCSVIVGAYRYKKMRDVIKNAEDESYDRMKSKQ